MSNNTVMANSTLSVLPSDDLDDDWFLIRLTSAFIDAIWEQSEKASVNRLLWDRFGGITTYCCSIYGISCLAMALVLNRTLVMASTNSSRHQQHAISGSRGLVHSTSLTDILRAFSMIGFKAFAIGLLLYNGYNILVALNLYYQIGLMLGGTLPWFTKFIPSGLFEYDPDFFSPNKYMATPKNQVMIGPTSDMYWPVFLGFCFLLFIETFASVIHGKQPYTESGITIFEHSLAFQEVSSRGGIFGSSQIHKRPTEQVLVACIFLTLNHLNIHIGGLLNGNKYRLIPLTIIGLSFLTYFISCFTSGLLWRFPTIIIISFTPQVLILLIILISILIFAMAVLAKGFQLNDLNYASFLLYENQENDAEFASRNLNVSLSDDFYTALLNIGMLAITLAGKSSYITELSLVTVDYDTWLERSIWEKIKLNIGSLARQNQNQNSNISNHVMNYLKEHNISGYGNMIVTPSKRLISGELSDIFRSDTSDLKSSKNISVFRKRYLFLIEMITDLIQLLYALIIDSFLLDILPRYFNRLILRRPVEQEKSPDEGEEEFEARKRRTPSFLRQYIKKHSVHPTHNMDSQNKAADLLTQSINVDDFSDEQLSQNYISLLLEKEISEIDNSEDYYQSNAYELEHDFDSDIESIDLSSSSYVKVTGIDQNDSPTMIGELFTPEEFQNLMTSTNVDILQQHINHDSQGGILTRAKFNALTRGANFPFDNTADQDETSRLMDLILSKRGTQINQLSNPERVDKSDDFYNTDSKLDCVICQTNVREIITWPCKCFAICESCRLSLVSKGIEGCVCCRRDVEGVSKVYIP